MADISKMLVPAAAGGLVAGIATSIPVVNWLNVLCCLWFIIGGAIAAWMLIRGGGKIKLTDGAIVGAISGIIAGIIAAVLGTILGIAGSIFNNIVNVPGASGIGLEVFMGIIGIFIYPILGAIFGAIGGVIFAKLKE